MFERHGEASRPSTRYKDLLDIVAIVISASVDAGPQLTALRSEAERRGILLSDDVMSFLMTRFSRDLKHLMTLLDRLDEFALAEHRAVTVPLLKKLFEEEGATL